jgi:hypothetical protein
MKRSDPSLGHVAARLWRSGPEEVNGPSQYVPVWSSRELASSLTCVGWWPLAARGSTRGFAAATSMDVDATTAGTTVTTCDKWSNLAVAPATSGFRVPAAWIGGRIKGTRSDARRGWRPWCGHQTLEQGL